MAGAADIHGSAPPRACSKRASSLPPRGHLGRMPPARPTRPAGALNSTVAELNNAPQNLAQTIDEAAQNMAQTESGVTGMFAG